MRDISDIIISEQQFSKRAGTAFEEDMLWSMQKSFPSIKNCIGTSMDKYEGTDFVHNSLRLDATLDMHDKNNMPFIFDTDIPATSWQNFKMGVRIANDHNGYNEFSDPVIVIGLDMNAHTYNVYQDEIVANMEKHADDLMFAASDAYLDYITDDKEERKELFSQPLRPNDTFVKPKNISERYELLNELQNNIMEYKDKGDLDYA